MSAVCQLGRTSSTERVCGGFFFLWFMGFCFLLFDVSRWTHTQSRVDAAQTVAIIFRNWAKVLSTFAAQSIRTCGTSGTASSAKTVKAVRTCLWTTNTTFDFFTIVTFGGRGMRTTTPALVESGIGVLGITIFRWQCRCRSGARIADGWQCARTMRCTGILLI